MTKQLMIYERAVPVSSDAHRDWSVQAGRDFSFASEINSVPLLAAEFAAAAGEHTIVFAGEGDAIFPSVILGQRDGQNAHVNAEGTWLSGYIPAFLRRYPFVFAGAEDTSNFTLCIDEEFDGFNKDGKGERLFDSAGERTEYLERMLKFTSDYQTQFNRTQMFAKRLADLDLLEPAQAQFRDAEGKQSSLTGFKTIKRDALRQLSGDTLAEMAKTDELELCYLHLHSLTNLPSMNQRLAQKAAA
ncbi:SapC protein [Monaibacterium marinum]|uniref:SapC protein n=1 Tax=Pontivivens marinum TaxID=1690039 RepID=A0A2C9CSC8_9RHOB|nr:SapC family protein [Monaibacterium marinum]SOH93279.1 SapC protein [Monaibacterium marinum]